MKRILVTGSAGLIGSEVSAYFAERGWVVYGIDNNQRLTFFGEKGDTTWNLNRLVKQLGSNYIHYSFDLRDRQCVLDLFSTVKPDAIVHAAAQPSHDLASRIVFDDFETNALATLNLLEACRRYCAESPFVFMSTNKVYGDKPNHLNLLESSKRFDFADQEYTQGISEDFGIDLCTHSLFGASKASADLLVQEYGRYFGLPTVCLRGGCLTGPNHSGVQLHGFLSYLLYCNYYQQHYTIYGYKGKQVRDNIHAFDVASFIEQYVTKPIVSAVYNIGGGKENSCSILEAFEIAESISGKKQLYDYSSANRVGDHICYYSDLSSMKNDYPNWSITKSLQVTFSEILASFES